MKNIIILLTVAMTLVSCTTRKGYFTIEGRFLNLNQGEFYAYSTDGTISGIDTIKVNGGRFAIEIPCTRQGTLTLVFPNFSEQPIFAEPGKDVDIKADASHLKQMEVTGTKDNELMTTFRQAIATKSPPEATKTAENFIRDNAASPVAIYLLQKYFIKTGNQTDYNKAKELLSVITKEQPHDRHIAIIKRNLDILAATGSKKRIASFKANDINGKTITDKFFDGKTGIICAWATWNYDSENMLRHINTLCKQATGKYAVIGINVDASKSTCRDAMKRNDVTFTNICDEQLFESSLLATLGIHTVPANIIISPNGKVLARDITTEDLDRYIK